MSGFSGVDLGLVRSILINTSLTNPELQVMRGSPFPVTRNFWPLENRASAPNRCWGDVPQRFSLGPVLSIFIAMFKSVMFIHRSLYCSGIAAPGKGPSLSRVFSSLQKLLLSQRRDSRLNNQFPITVTIWEQLFASEGLPTIVHGALKQRRKEKEAWRERKMKEKFFSAWFSPLKGLILIPPTDLQMYV